MYQYRKTRFSKHLDFLISDIFAFELSLFLAYMFRFGKNPIAVKAYGYTEISALIVLVNLIVAFFLESYSGILTSVATLIFECQKLYSSNFCVTSSYTCSF